MCQAHVGKDSIRLRILFVPVFPLPSAQPDFRKRLVARYRLEPGQIRDGCPAPATIRAASSANASSVTQSDWILLAACAAVLCLGIVFVKKYHVVK